MSCSTSNSFLAALLRKPYQATSKIDPDTLRIGIASRFLVKRNYGNSIVDSFYTALDPSRIISNHLWTKFYWRDGLNVYKTEEEQVEDIKRWTKAYGPSILIGILLALAITYGWRYWNVHQTHRYEQASKLYQILVATDKDKKNNNINQLVKELKTDYPSTPYAAFATMMVAKNAILQKQYDQAISALQWVVHQNSNEDLSAIAELRIARIQLEQNKPNLALETLNKIKNPAYDSMISYAEGNAYLAQKDYQKASDAYHHAISSAPNPQDLPSILNIKLDNLPITNTDTTENKSE
jgi:predicted negative regulator of RcsB-dependent stress response